MATVDGITVARAQAIEDASVVSGAINVGNGHLILHTAGGTDIDAGVARPDAAIAAAVLVETNNRITDVNTEETARIAADSTEQAARIAADSAEVTARNAAIALLPKGRVGYIYTAADTIAVSNGEVVNGSITFTADATRRYWFHVAASGYSTVAQKVLAPKVRWAAGATVTTAGTQIGAIGAIETPLIGAVCTTSGIVEIAPGVFPNGQVTVGVTHGTVTGPGGTITGRQYMLAGEDKGI